MPEREDLMQSEVVRTFEDLIEGPNGANYLARICGRPAGNGLWHGWIEFVPEKGTPVLRSRRETTQPNRRNLVGWAGRLTGIYLEGALNRTLRLEEPRPAPVPGGTVRPRFEGPAPHPPPGRSVAPDDAAVNPLLLYRRGESTLRQELEELSTSELRTVVRGYDLSDEDSPRDVGTLVHAELVDLIIRAVRERILQ